MAYWNTEYAESGRYLLLSRNGGDLLASLHIEDGGYRFCGRIGNTTYFNELMDASSLPDAQAELEAIVRTGLESALKSACEVVARYKRQLTELNDSN